MYFYISVFALFVWLEIIFYYYYSEVLKIPDLKTSISKNVTILFLFVYYCFLHEILTTFATAKEMSIALFFSTSFSVSTEIFIYSTLLRFIYNKTGHNI